MRFVVYGAGAIGGVIGGRLFEYGHDVILIARGPHGEAIREHGMTLAAPDATVTLPIRAVATAAEAGIQPDDVVLLTVKSQDTEEAVAALAGAAAPETPVVCVQNGVENERRALRLFRRVYGVCVMCPTTHLHPGVVEAHSAPVTGILDVGRYPSGIDQVAEATAAALRLATFSSEARTDIVRWKYCKLLTNLGNAVEAVCGPAARPGPIGARAKEEGAAVLRAAGIDFATDQEDAERRDNLLNLRPIEGRRRGGGSSWQSLTRRSGSIETDYLNGEIVLLGRLHGVPTPVNALLQHHAGDLARHRMRPGSISEQDFLSQLDRGTLDLTNDERDRRGL